MIHYCEQESYSCSADTVAQQLTVVTTCNSDIGHDFDRFKEPGNNVGQLYDVIPGLFHDYGDISTNWDCQDTSVDSGLCFVPYSSDCCLGSGSKITQFEPNYIKRTISSFPSAEIPLKMVVGNHHSMQTKLTFSRHLLRKRCFKSSSRKTSGKMSCNKPTKTKSDNKDTLDTKAIKSNILKVKATQSNVAEPKETASLEDDDDCSELSLGDRRQVANARERQRVSHLNEGFDKLRRVLPWMRRSRRVSKVDTLRGAIAYIKYLQQQVWTREVSSGCMDCTGSYCMQSSGMDHQMTSSMNSCYVKPEGTNRNHSFLPMCSGM